MTTRLLRMSEVISITSLSQSAIYERIRDGRFPAPVSIGARAVAFRSDEIQAWIDAQPRVNEADRPWTEKQRGIMEKARSVKAEKKAVRAA